MAPRPWGRETGEWVRGRCGVSSLHPLAERGPFGIVVLRSRPLAQPFPPAPGPVCPEGAGALPHRGRWPRGSPSLFCLHISTVKMSFLMTRRKIKRRQNNIAAFTGRGRGRGREGDREPRDRRHEGETETASCYTHIWKGAFLKQRDGGKTEKPFPAAGLQLRAGPGVVLGAPGPDGRGGEGQHLKWGGRGRPGPASGPGGSGHPSSLARGPS